MIYRSKRFTVITPPRYNAPGMTPPGIKQNRCCRVDPAQQTQAKYLKSMSYRGKIVAVE